jgi:hypothetical protein
MYYHIRLLQFAPVLGTIYVYANPFIHRSRWGTTPGILCRPDPTRHRAAAATLEAAAASGRTLLRRWPTSAALLLPTPVNISVSA